MDVVIAGGHGQIGLRLARLLAARGDRVRGLIRNPAHAADLEAAGAEPVLLDLEAAGPSEVAAATSGADAVVFAAGAGPGSGAARKWTLDLGGAVKLVDTARANGTERYVIVSSIGAHAPEAIEDDGFRVYLEAKGAADDVVRASGLAWTVVRPGSLTDDPGTGHVEVSTELGRRAAVTRDDVAAVLAAVLAEPRTAGATFELFGGTTPVADAVYSLVTP